MEGVGVEVAMGVIRRLAWFLVLVPLVAAGAGDALATSKLPVPYQKEILFTRSDFSFAGGPHELRAAVYGNPFGIDDARLEDLVLDAMQPDQWGWRAVRPSMTFTVQPSSDDWRGLHVAVFLDPRPLDDPEAYCRAPGEVSFRPPSAEIALRFVFCNGATLFSTTFATTPHVGEPDEKGFRKLLAQMSRGLWPIRYVDVQMGSAQAFLEYKQRHLAHPELFGFGFGETRHFVPRHGGGHAHR